MRLNRFCFLVICFVFFSSGHVNAQHDNPSGQSVVHITSGVNYGSLLRFERFSQNNLYYSYEAGAGGNDDLRFFTDSWATPIMLFRPEGNIGFGTGNPIGNYHFNSNGQTIVSFTSGTANGSILRMERYASGGNYFTLETGAGNNDDLRLFTSAWSTPIMLFSNNGNVGIGTTLAPDAKLTVAGDIHTQEVTVDLLGAVVPDYVFNEEYDLMSLVETEDYIVKNKHLPDIPSASEMGKEGIELKTMNLKLLKKIEELTLHLIEQDKKIKVLESRMDETQKD